MLDILQNGKAQAADDDQQANGDIDHRVILKGHQVLVIANQVRTGITERGYGMEYAIPQSFPKAVKMCIRDRNTAQADKAVYAAAQREGGAQPSGRPAQVLCHPPLLVPRRLWQAASCLPKSEQRPPHAPSELALPSPNSFFLLRPICLTNLQVLPRKCQNCFSQISSGLYTGHFQKLVAKIISPQKQAFPYGVSYTNHMRIENNILTGCLLYTSRCVKETESGVFDMQGYVVRADGGILHIRQLSDDGADNGVAHIRMDAITRADWGSDRERRLEFLSALQSAAES